MDDKKDRYQLIAILVFLPLGLLLYNHALHAPFVYDDRGYIVHNDAIRSLANFTDLSGTRYLGFLSFALNYYVSGFTPFDYHLFNVIIHVINSALVFLLVDFTFKTPLARASTGAGGAWAGFAVALASSAVFLSHPVETQAVAYVTQRFASLATLFYLLTVVCYAKAKLQRAEGKRGFAVMYFISLASAVLAMKTKEISFTLPFAVALYDRVFFNAREKADAFMRIPFYLTLFIIPLALLADNGQRVSENLRDLQMQEAANLERVDYVYTQFRVIVTYLRLLVFPAWQKLDYDYPVYSSLSEPAVFISLIFLLSVLASSLWLLISSYRRKNIFGVLTAFGVMWFFLTLAIESFAVPIKDVIFEHRLYLPSIGLIISFSSVMFWITDSLFRRSGRGVSVSFFAAVFILVFGALSYATYERNKVWGDELRLINESIGEGAKKARLYYIRAMVHVERGDFQNALADAGKAVSLEDKSADMYNLRGFAYSGLGRYSESLEDFNRAIEVNPKYFLAYYNRGRSHAFLKMRDRAVSDYTRAIEFRPDYDDAFNNRGILFYEAGETGKALEDFQKACSLGNKLACKNLAVLKRGRL